MNDMQTRRNFMQSAVAAGIAVPTVVGSRRHALANESQSPNDKLNIGCIGVGGRGAANVNGVASENIVALCDIDSQRLNASHEQFPQAAKYTDYRKLLERTDLDAIVISTPDHTHALPAVAALQSGLDVYCEKPLAHSVYEVRRMREAARNAGAVTQMGTQIHSLNNYRRVVEIIQAGTIGDVERVHVWKGNSVEPGQRVGEGTPPAHVDYDLWTGPAPLRPFHESHFHYHWRNWFDFGGGTLADFGCHFMDLPFWALQLGDATTVCGKGEKTYRGDNEPPDNMRVDYHFPPRRSLPGVHLTWYQGAWRPDWIADYGLQAGVLFEGANGKLVADYGTHKLFHMGSDDHRAPVAWIPDSLGHHQEWIAACKSRGGTTCNFEYSGRLTEAVLLGNVSYRTGGKELHWDAEGLVATNCPEAARFVKREYRSPWQLT